MGGSVYFVIAQWFSPVEGFVSLQAFASRLAFYLQFSFLLSLFFCFFGARLLFPSAFTPEY